MDTSDAYYHIQDHYLHKTPSPPTLPVQETPRTLTKHVFLKYIHQYLDRFPYILPRDNPEATQFRSDNKFIPEELKNSFGCQRLRKYSRVAAAAKHVNLTIGETPPPILGDFTTILQNPKGKTISCPDNLLQRIHIDIRYGVCGAFGGHIKILALVEQSTCYIWTHGLQSLSWFSFIQHPKEFRLDVGHLSSKFYTKFDKRMIQGGSHRCLLTN